LSDHNRFGNPGSLHNLGRIAEGIITEAQKAISTRLQISPLEIYFTSGGTESINAAIRGYLEANPRAGKHIISTATEHKATLEVLKHLEKSGYVVTYIPVSSSGIPDLEQLKHEIRQDTALITLTHVNNETGAIMPMSEISKIRNKMNPKTKIHLDCVQSLGKIPILLNHWGIDFASFSGHKIHCVKGVGVLYVRSGNKISPLIIGGGQQRGLRSGTESPYLAASMSLAIEKAYEQMEVSYNRVLKCKQILLDKLASLDAIINSPENSCPYIVNFTLQYIEPETLLHAMEQEDIYISTVSACASKTKKTSHVLLAMGIDRSVAKGAVRFSLSRFTTEEEMLLVCEALVRVSDKYKLY
jgi:cysteine desulfurase